jgi:signal transduction histidine kinase
MATGVERPARREAALITGASVVGALALMTRPGDWDGPGTMLPVAQIICYTLILGAAVLHYYHWRVSRVEQDGEIGVRLTGWLTVGLVLGASHGLVVAVTGDAEWQLTAAHWPSVTLVVVLSVLCLLALVAERVDVPGDPALLGGAAASLLVAGSSFVPRLVPPSPPGPATIGLIYTAAILAAMVLIWILLHRHTVALRVRRQLATAVALLTAGQLASGLDDPSFMVATAAIAAQVAAALVVCDITQRLLRGSILERQEQVRRLQRSLAEVREAVGKERELLHEVGATLAGITNATRVMRHGQAVPASRRQRLESMLDAELDRLERLMQARVSGAMALGDCEIDIDEVVEPLVTSHIARGRDVRWFASGECVFGDPDELAEVVNILLENAGRHGGRGVVRLSVTAADGGALVICSDSGPGVPSELRDRLFEPEVRGPASKGQGLGLAIVHRLVSARGGTIELVGGHQPGATFVARLPRRSAVDAVRNIA